MKADNGNIEISSRIRFHPMEQSAACLAGGFLNEFKMIRVEDKHNMPLD
ncbi:MAG: hypothetical protein JXB10_14965 [Pirellulales bacterium]|nr:hypothetical protein [Pirellulales bacterium]